MRSSVQALFRWTRLVPASLVVVLACASATVAWPATAGADTQPSHFIWTSPTGGAYTLINNGATNGNPGAILFVTSNAKPNGVCGCVSNTIPVGVFYDTAAAQWGIFCEQTGITVQAGVSFNVLVVPSATSNVFTITSSPSNINGDTTWINNSVTNDEPAAILQVTPNGDAGGEPIVYNDQVPGVWFNASKWGVFNESEAPMPVGVSFNVLVGAASSGGGKTKTVKAPKPQNKTNGVEFNNPTTNGDSNAFVLDTPNYDPNGIGGVIDTSQTDVLYDGQFIDVANSDNAVMKKGTAFNLLFWNS
jgi:hypothetical protein